MTETCYWKEQDFDMAGTWLGECGIEWTLEDGTPKENEMNFCPKCGKPLVEIRFVYDDKEDTK